MSKCIMRSIILFLLTLISSLLYPTLSFGQKVDTQIQLEYDLVYFFAEYYSIDIDAYRRSLGVGPVANLINYSYFFYIDCKEILTYAKVLGIQLENEDSICRNSNNVTLAIDGLIYLDKELKKPIHIVGKAKLIVSGTSNYTKSTFFEFSIPLKGRKLELAKLFILNNVSTGYAVKVPGCTILISANVREVNSEIMRMYIGNPDIISSIGLSLDSKHGEELRNVIETILTSFGGAKIKVREVEAEVSTRSLTLITQEYYSTTLYYSSNGILLATLGIDFISPIVLGYTLITTSGLGSTYIILVYANVPELSFLSNMHVASTILNILNPSSAVPSRNNIVCTHPLLISTEELYTLVRFSCIALAIALVITMIIYVVRGARR